VLGTVTDKAARSLARLSSPGEEPWLVLAPGGASGVLAAWDDRLAIVKTGALTSFMAGSLGGERAAVFHFVDITGIEYNSGLISGVLEILTPSYHGTANSDFWRGTHRSRNANSNDPFTLSNTLPLPKPLYQAWTADIQTLRSRIAAFKRPAGNRPQESASTPIGAASALAVGPPPGWLHDPENPRQLRWWDGQRFAGATKPIERDEISGQSAPAEAVPAPPQGWYDDPGDASLVRWWSGTSWTASTQTRPQSHGGP
jgi:hypothetical protein